MPFFAMGRDLPNGTMSLTHDGYLEVDWRKRKGDPPFDDIRATATRWQVRSTRASSTTRPGT
jgi:hypothetical protein